MAKTKKKATRSRAAAATAPAGWANVKLFGAKGDGTHDDTAAIQSAIDAAKVVLFPPGTYLLSAPLALRSNRVLVGAGIDATTLIPKVASIALISAVASGSTMLNLEIRNMQLANAGKAGITAVSLDGATPALRISDVRLHDLLIVGCERGLAFRLVANSFVGRVFCALCATGFRFDTCADTNVSDCQAQNGGAAGFEIVSTHVREGEGYRLANCSTNGQGLGLTITGQDWGSAVGCSFTTCTVGPATLLVGTTTWQFAGCEFSPAAGFPAFDTDAGCDDVQLTGCVLAIATVGIALRGRRCVLSGCNIGDNTGTDVVLDGALQTVVSGNQCDSTATAHSIQEMGAANFNAIQGNVCHKDIAVVGAGSIAAGNVIDYV